MWIWNDMQNSNFKTDHIAYLPSFLVEFYRHQNTLFCLGIACSLYHPFTLLEVSIFIGQTVNLQDELGKPGHIRMSFNRGYNTFRFISTKSWYFSRYCKEPSTVFHYRDTLKGFPMTVEQVFFFFFQRNGPKFSLQNKNSFLVNSNCIKPQKTKVLNDSQEVFQQFIGKNVDIL